MITNENNQIAIKYFQTIPHAIRVRDYDYAFIVRANICMAWINSEHVDTVLAMKRRKCCGNGGGAEYRYANESDVRRWICGGGR